MNGRNIAAAVAVIVLLGSGAVACSDFKEGPAGKVTDRDRDVKVKTKVGSNGKPKTRTTVTYELTTMNEKGEESEFKVSSSTYDKCVVGSQYPKCLNK